MAYSDYKYFRFEFDTGVAFVTIDHPPINLLDEYLSPEFDRLGRELEADESVRVVVLQSAVPEFFMAHSGLGRVGTLSKTVSHTRTFRLTQTIGERFRNMPKVSIAKIEGRARGGGSEIALAMDMRFAAVGKAVFAQPEVAIGLVPGVVPRRDCRGSWGGGAPWRCFWVAMTSRRRWQNATATSIGHCRRTS